MALIMNVGNYTAPEDSSWLPEDFPSCDHPFLKGAHKEPACTCFQNKDAVLAIGLTEDYRCSRDYLCSHIDSEVSQLASYKPSGVSMRSQYRIPNYGLTLIFLAIIAFLTFGVIPLKHYIKNSSAKTSESHTRQSLMMRFKMINTIAGKKGISHLVSDKTSQQYFSTLDFWTQLKLLTASQFKAYRPGCVNLWRIFEVSTLAMLVGLLFYDVGNKETSESLTQKSGLLFFSVTLWTFTRMYPAVGSTSIWRNLAIDFSKSLKDKNMKMKYVFILWLARVIVIFVCESWLPLIHVLVAYPMAGAITSNVSIGMIVSTLVSQISLLAAGFYTTLPPVINLLRYISPVTYTYTGILKSSFRSSDTYRCQRGGQSDVGANQCYIEQSVGIDILKRRGINVATFNDPYTESIWMEVMILFGLYVLLNCAILAFLLFKIHRRKEGDADLIDEEDRQIARVANSETPVERRGSATWSNASLVLERKNQLDLAFLADVTKYDDEQSHVSSLNPFLDRDSMSLSPRFRSSPGSPGSPGYSGRRTIDPQSFSTFNPKRFRNLNKEIKFDEKESHDSTLNPVGEGEEEQSITQTKEDPKRAKTSTREIRSIHDLDSGRITKQTPLQFKEDVEGTEVDNRKKFFQDIEHVTGQMKQRYMNSQSNFPDDLSYGDFSC